MASRRDRKAFPSEVVEIESLLLNLKQRSKRKLADCESDVYSQDSRDRDAFFQRVQTFSIITWFGKPAGLSPLQCAKYGWVNSESDMLQCGVCRAVICAALPVNYDPKVYQTCVKKLTDKLTSAHEHACKWRSNPTPDSLIRVPTHSKAEVKEGFNKRLQSLLLCGNKLPYINTVTMETEGVTDTTLSTLAEHLLSNSSKEGADDLEIMKRASAISFCGWKNRSDDVEDILFCDFCQRNIGLWNYKSPHWHQTRQESECDTVQNSDQSLTDPVQRGEEVSQNKSQNGVEEGHVNSGENKSSDCELKSSGDMDQGQSESSVSESGACSNDEPCENNGDQGNNSIAETHSGSTKETTNMDVDGSELSKNEVVNNSEDSHDTVVVQTEIGSNDNVSPSQDSDGRDSTEDRKDSDKDKKDSNADGEDNAASPLRDSNERDSNADRERNENEGCVSIDETEQKSQSETNTDNLNGRESESSCELVSKSNGCSEETKVNFTANGVETKDNVCPMNSELNHDQKDSHAEEEKSENENTITNGETKEESKSETDIVKEMKSSHDVVKSNSCSEEETRGDDTKAVANEQTDEAPKSPEMPPGGESKNGPSETGELPRKRMKLEEKDSFDPLAEHRTWCPWSQKSCDTSPWKQSESDAVLPWKKVLNMVGPYVKERNPGEMSLSSQYKEVSPVVALERMRRIMNDWTSTVTHD